IYPRLTARQISNMPHRSYDFVSFTKVLFDGFGFGRRFDNNQIIRHFRLPPFTCLFKSKQYSEPKLFVNYKSINFSDADEIPKEKSSKIFSIHMTASAPSLS